QIEGNVQAFIGNFHPFTALAPPFPAPGHSSIVVAWDRSNGRWHGVGTGCQSVDFNESHRGTAYLRGRCIQDEPLALQHLKAVKKKIYPHAGANCGPEQLLAAGAQIGGAGHSSIVVAWDRSNGCWHGVGTGCQSVDFNESHRGTAYLRGRCIQDEPLALQHLKAVKKKIYPHAGANCGPEQLLAAGA